MSSLPILLVKPRILLIGGGKVAFRKAGVLLDNKIEFKVVAKSYIEEFDKLGIDRSSKWFELNDLSGYDIVVDATGDASVAQVIIKEKQKRNLMVNFVTDAKRSDFFFPALINYGELKIAVSTEGASPTIGKFVRDKIREFIPQGINRLLQELTEDRKSGMIAPEVSLKQIEEVFTVNEEEKTR